MPQASEPTTTAGTSAAEPPRVPPAVVAVFDVRQNPVASFRASTFRSDLEAVLEAQGLRRDSLRIVPSVLEYCVELGVSPLDRSKDPIGRCLTSPDAPPLFLIRDEITESAHSDALVPLVVRKFPAADVARLNDPLTFLKQLLLHEVAHFVRKDLHAGACDVERDCDIWAFSKL